MFPFAAAALLAACSPDYSPNTCNGDAVQQAAKVEAGHRGGRAQKIGVSAQGVVGAATGAAAGGAVEFADARRRRHRGAGRGRQHGLIGGLVGTAAEHASDDTTAYEYVVREPKGDLVSVTQQDAVPLQIGTHVLVIAGKQARIVRDYTVRRGDPADGIAFPPRTAQSDHAAANADAWRCRRRRPACRHRIWRTTSAR